MSRSCYIIDGHAQIYRAYFAPFGNLSSPTGEPVRATHVFCQMIVGLVRDRRPDYLVMTLDGPEEKLHRKRLYPEYKSHREPAPDDLWVQEKRIIAILRAVGMPILTVEGYEADDVIATLATRHASDDLHVYLVSRDKDLEQVLSPHVSMFDPGKNEIITPERLVQLKGWTPAQAIDAQTLIGDPVDNVPGVPGIGPKTAAKLLQKYATADRVIACAHELTPKQRENVLAFAPFVARTRELVTLRCDVPFDFDLETARLERLRWSAAKSMLSELGFRRLVEQWPQSADDGVVVPIASDADPPGTASSVASPAAAVAAGGADERAADGSPRTAAAAAGKRDSASSEAAQGAAETAREIATLLSARDMANRPASGADVAARLTAAAAALREPDPGAWRLVNTMAALDAFANELAIQREFTVDTETTGVNPIDAELVGLAFSWRAGEGWYVPVRSMYGQSLPVERVRERLAPILANPQSRKVGHNLKYDLIILRHAGLPASGDLFDTMIAAFVVDPARSSYGLDPLARAWFGHEMIPISDLIGKGRDQLRMDQVPVEQVAEYAGEDADYTWRLRMLLEPELAPAGVEPLFRDTEMPLVEVLTEMEFHGIRVDVPFLKKIGEEMSARAGRLVDEVHRLVGRPFNLDSPKQLAEVLFDQLGFRVVKTTRTSRSTDAETLETLADETGHPALALLLEHRELQKLRGTYVDALPAAISKRTGRVHTSFHQTGAITGRLSSSEPNLQNIPIRTPLGRQIRKAFVPRTTDELLVVADYSQIELRVLAHYCEDEALIDAFREDRDIHAFVAAQVNGVALDAVTKDMRSRAKAVNFGIIYGQTAHGLSRSTGMSRTEAQQFIDDYFRRYPRVRSFIDRCIADARREGSVRTILGRRRPIPDSNSPNKAVRAQAERLAVNTVMQGSAADLIKIAMVRLHRRIHAERLPLRILLQVHDELVMEAPRSTAEDMARVAAEVMSGALPLRVPLKVDVATGENWLEAK
ncbi:MAG: DNA polymerase I [Phycisphaerae bacterium]